MTLPLFGEACQCCGGSGKIEREPRTIGEWLDALGNAVIPQIAEWIGARLIASEAAS